MRSDSVRGARAEGRRREAERGRQRLRWREAAGEEGAAIWARCDFPTSAGWKISPGKAEGLPVERETSASVCGEGGVLSCVFQGGGGGGVQSTAAGSGASWKKKNTNVWLGFDWDGERRDYLTPGPGAEMCPGQNLQFRAATLGPGEVSPPTGGGCCRWWRRHLSCADSGGDNAKRHLGSDPRLGAACLRCLVRVKHQTPRSEEEKTKSDRIETLWIPVGTLRCPPPPFSRAGAGGTRGSARLPELISGSTKGFVRMSLASPAFFSCWTNRWCSDLLKSNTCQTRNHPYTQYLQRTGTETAEIKIGKLFEGMVDVKDTDFTHVPLRYTILKWDPWKWQI